MRRALVALALVVVTGTSAACARLYHLRRPPRAWLMAVEMPTWTCSAAGCHAAGVLQNVGNGCAMSIAGTVILLDAAGRSLEEARAFAFPPQQILDPQDYVEWRVEFIPIAVASAVDHVVVEPRWTLVPCNAGAGWIKHRKR